jgi:DNA-binding NarL/FixJ family response regulator
MPIRVLVYDDNKSRQEALRILLDSRDDMECVGVYENCATVENDISQNSPDVVLMDIDMPGVNGIEGLKRIRKHSPKVLIVMQTIYEEEDKIFDAVHAGAHGYFLKKTAPAKLIEGIHDVLEGGAPMTASVARKVLEMFQQQPPGSTNKSFDLTDREVEILGMLVKGMSYKMISAACNITYHTVNSHCKKIYEKLHVHSATEAVAKAINQRIV